MFAVCSFTKRPSAAFLVFVMTLSLLLVQPSAGFCGQQPASLSELQKRVEQAELQLKEHREGQQRELDLLKTKVELSSNYVGIGHKQVDYWIGFLTLLLAVLAVMVAVGAIVIPIFLTRNLRAEYERSRDGAREAADSARNAAQVANEHAKKAANEVEAILAQSDSVQAFNSNPEGLGRSTELSMLERRLLDVRASEEQKLQAEAMLYQAAENWEAAVAVAHKVVEKFESSSNSYNFLGFCLQNLARMRSMPESEQILDEAISNYEKEAVRSPNRWVARDNIGWALIEKALLQTSVSKKSKLLDKALVNLDKAILLDQLSTTTLNNMAWALINKADIESDPTNRESSLSSAKQKLLLAQKLNPDLTRTKANLEYILGFESKGDEN